MVTDFELEEGTIKILGVEKLTKLYQISVFFINITEAFPHIWPPHTTRILSSLYIESMCFQEPYIILSINKLLLIYQACNEANNEINNPCCNHAEVNLHP